MPKKAQSIKIDKKYTGLGTSFETMIYFKGVATNLQKEMRDIGHCLYIYGLPNLKYGWSNIPKETALGLGNWNYINKSSPRDKILLWSGDTVKYFDVSNKQIKGSVSFSGVYVRFADFIDDATAYACLENDTTARIFVGIDGSLTIDRTYSANGYCGELYRGRLFLGDGKVLRFSNVKISDHSYTDDVFATANDGGWIIITDPQVSKIVDLRVINDLLYIFTDGGLFFLSASITSASASGFYLTYSGLRWNFDKNKILTLYKRAFVISNLGIYELITANMERKDLIIADQLSILDTSKAGLSYYYDQNLLIIPYKNQDTSLVYSFEYDLYSFLPKAYCNALYTSNATNISYNAVLNDINYMYSSTTDWYPLNIKSVYHDYGTNQYKYIREIQIEASHPLNLKLWFDGKGADWSGYMLTQQALILNYYRRPFGAKGYLVALEVNSSGINEQVWLGKIRLKGHLLGEVNYFYATS